VWVGVWKVADEETPEGECWLAPGDVLLLYTDGILEARAASGEAYGPDRLDQLLTSTGELPVQAICDAIMKDVSAWMGRQDDDITVVVARHTGAP
jgi:sigma-B regulation protein RsbU (phosphoserine phosphatase)